MRLSPRLAALGLLLILAPGRAKADPNYTQINLVSDLSTVGAQIVDPSLKNPWGLSHSGTSPFWVANQESNNNTLYAVTAGNTVTKNPLTVTMPTIGAPPTGPTGQVFNNVPGGFAIPAPNGGTVSSTFIFNTLNGTIAGWNPNSVGGMNSAVTMVDNSSTSGGPRAIYTGLTQANFNGGAALYAANTANNTIEVYNSSFQRVGTLNDATPVAGFSVYNVQAIGNSLFAAYGMNQGPIHFPGGYVNEFDLNGNFVRQIALSGPDGPLSDPWGIALAPSTFGIFGGDLLVGNLFDSKISAYDISGPTAVFKGQITVDTGFASPVGLWGLSFGTGGNNGNPNSLYITVGINDEANGLFAALTPVPEPPSSIQAGLAALGGSLVYARRRWTRRAKDRSGAAAA